MIQKIRGLVVNTVRHNDRHNIITLFTEQRGRVAFLCPAGCGKTARMRAARLAPMALVETDVNFHESRDLQFIGSISTPHPWRNLYFDPMKSAMTLFLSDFLNRLCRTSEADTPLWTFLLQSLHSLDIMERGTANFHIAFLIRLLPLLGISPDTDTYSDGLYFDMANACFTDPMTPGLPAIDRRALIYPEDAAFIPTLSRISYRNLSRFRLNRDSRQKITSLLLRYYSLHLPLPESLPSLDVLHELFS